MEPVPGFAAEIAARREQHLGVDEPLQYLLGILGLGIQQGGRHPRSEPRGPHRAQEREESALAVGQLGESALEHRMHRQVVTLQEAEPPGLVPEPAVEMLDGPVGPTAEQGAGDAKRQRQVAAQRDQLLQVVLGRSAVLSLRHQPD